MGAGYARVHRRPSDALPQLHSRDADDPRHLPHCGHAKEGRPGLRARKVASGDFWGDLDDLLFFSLMLAPGLALLIVALVFVASDPLLLAAIALLIAPVVARLVSYSSVRGMSKAARRGGLRRLGGWDSNPQRLG